MINKIYNEDCLQTMSRMPDNFVDLVVTSPPYDNLRSYKGYTFDFPAIARELYRVIKLGGVAVWVVGDQTVNGSETGTSFKQALYKDEVGFNLHDTMIYQKENYPPLTHRRYEQCFEYMFVLIKGKPKTFNPIKVKSKHEGRIPSGTFYHTSKQGVPTKANNNKSVNPTKIKSNIWQYVVGGKKYGHPAPFPEQLAYDHILSWSNAGDLVYDPMVGSGTTCRMAKKLLRNYIGSEVCGEYCEIAQKLLGAGNH